MTTPRTDIATDADYDAHVAQHGRCPFQGPCDGTRCRDLPCADDAGESPLFDPRDHDQED